MLTDEIIGKLIFIGAAYDSARESVTIGDWDSARVHSEYLMEYVGYIVDNVEHVDMDLLNAIEHYFEQLGKGIEHRDRSDSLAALYWIIIMVRRLCTMNA